MKHFVRDMIAFIALVMLLLGLLSVPKANSQTLPPQITPEIRRACESDVRRICVRRNTTVAEVIDCIYKKFYRLNKLCRIKIKKAGLI